MYADKHLKNGLVNLTMCIYAADPLWQRIIILKKSQSKPGQGWGLLTCPVISRLHFASPESKERWD